MGIESCVYEDDRLGIIHVRVLSTARRFIARWKNGEVYITIPPDTSPAQYDKVLEGFIPELLACKPKPPALFYDGYRFDGFDWSFEIRHSDGLNPLAMLSQLKMHGDRPHWIIMVGPDVDFSDPAHCKHISRYIDKHAAHVARKTLIHFAKEVAAQSGQHVTGWEVSHGLRTLGKCSSEGKISLSCRLAYLPPELRRYTITHELAHLTHFDHSPAFHALWAKLYGEPLPPVKQRLKSYRWPVY